jgi:hypothetical protein
MPFLTHTIYKNRMPPPKNIIINNNKNPQNDSKLSSALLTFYLIDHLPLGGCTETSSFPISGASQAPGNVEASKWSWKKREEKPGRWGGIQHHMGGAIAHPALFPMHALRGLGHKHLESGLLFASKKLTQVRGKLHTPMGMPLPSLSGISSRGLDMRVKDIGD